MIKCEFENGNKDSLRHACSGAIVYKGSKILLGKRKSSKGKVMLEAGKWSLLGGFMSRNETVAQAARREVLEESGYEIDNLKLLWINDDPNRPAEDRQNIDFIFIAKAKDKVAEFDDEVSEVKWFEIDKLPSKEEFAFDHYKSIELYKKYLKKKFDLPIFEK